MGFTRSILNWYSRLTPGRGRASPPYAHIVQIGDPTLRRISEPVALDKLKTEEIQKTLVRLEYVLKKYRSLGVSAPQIGVNLRIFAMQYTKQQLSELSKDIIERRGITLIPFTVFINPVLKVVDFKKVSHIEGCESVRGFNAEVPRYKQVEVSGYDTNGEKQTMQFSDWTARIVQHEIDHLDGKMYTDIMDKKTLSCICWEDVNKSKGKVTLPFTP